MKYHLPIRVLLGVIPLSFVVLLSATETAKAQKNVTNLISNPGFESSFNGWNDIDPSSISTIERSGSRAGKIDGSGGRIHQEVDISTNTTYELSVYIRGNGKLRAKVNGKNYEATRGNSSSYAKRSVTFNSGGDNDLDINLEYNGQTCRFDDVQLYEVGSSSSSSSSGNSSLSISNATGSSSGSNGPFNAIDGNLNSRFSTNAGNKYLQLDLGSTKTISSLDIAWFKGNQRKAFFDILVGTSTSNLTKVFDGTSSGNTLNRESYNFNDRSGRYVRIVGFGNTSNSWLSITDVNVIGSSSSTSSSSSSSSSSTSSNNSPSVSFATPSNNATFSQGSQVVVKVNASDDGKVSNVRLSVDGKFVRQENFAPYDWKTDSALKNLSSGSHTLTAVATDNTGKTSTTSITINVSGSSSSGSSSGGGSGTADAIIGSGWKLNGFKGTLKVGNNDNGLDYADSASKSESHFFFEKNGYAAFRCHPGSPTSGGSSNPRSELREQIKGGDNFWNGDTNTERSMKWKVRIEDLPPSGKLCFGQIHEKDDKFDDIIRVQVEGSSGQNSGSVKLRILGFVTEEILGSGQTAGNINMDQEYFFELTMKNGVVKLYQLNNSGSRTNTFFTSKDVGNANENYFKAGCYLQSTKSSDNESVFGQVLIKDLSLKIDD